MAHPQHTAGLALLEEAVTVLFCQIDDTYVHLNPPGGHYASLKQLSESERSSPSCFFSNSEEWSPNAPSCARVLGSSLICSLGSSVFILPLSIAECAS
jgi:hypothetical protein